MEQLDNVQILWDLGYYDGPISGILLYNNEIHYFDLLEEFEPKPIDSDDEDSEYDHSWYRKFGVYELSNDDKVRMIVTHAMWQCQVGLHTDYFPFNARNLHIDMALKKSKDTISPLHYGSSGQSNEAFQAHDKMRSEWETVHGPFKKDDKEPIGFIYYKQLFGKDD